MDFKKLISHVEKNSPGYISKVVAENKKIVEQKQAQKK